MISEELKKIIIRELQLNNEIELNDHTTANDVPGWDSLKHINIIVAVENFFNIKFKGLEILRIKNLGDLQQLIDKKKNNSFT